MLYVNFETLFQSLWDNIKLTDISDIYSKIGENVINT